MAAEPGALDSAVDGCKGSDAVVASQLLDAGLDIAYQPIVHLGSGSVIAYEALARPRHPQMSDPLRFFRALEQAGRRLDGERAALRAAVVCTTYGFPRAKLFLNASPLTLVDPEFDVGEFRDLVALSSLTTADLVVEVTESEAVEDLDALAARAQRLRRLGIGLAVDDAGAGHASFRVITRLRPSYIKLDRDLVSGIDRDGARRAFIQAMVRFARQIGARLVAEGVETEAELLCLAGLGVEAGQGYYLARPATGRFPRPAAAARRAIAASAQRLRLGGAQVTVGELAAPAQVVPPLLSIREAHAWLADQAAGSLVLLGRSRRRPAGCVSRRTIEMVLAVSEHLGDQPVSVLVQDEPLIVSADDDVVETAAMLATRPSHELPDELVVLNAQGGLVGTVGLSDVLGVLSRMRRPSDQDLHPLTGLPGAAWVESELGRRVSAGQAVAVLCFDLHGFRLLNEVGGYALGDETIRAVGRCLAGVAEGVADAAVAHVGGDDFLLLAPPSMVDELASHMVRRIEAEVMPDVRAELSLRGVGDVFERFGASVATVDLVAAPAPGRGYLGCALGELGAAMEVAKSHPGYALARRTGGTIRVTTWRPRGPGQRSLSIGLAEPGVILRAVAQIDALIGRWWVTAPAERPRDAFPGPPALLTRLRTEVLGPLERQASSAAERRVAVMEVQIRGDEGVLLDLLDRLAVLLRQADLIPRVPIPPEGALLERLTRQRARVLVREDRAGHATELAS